MCTSADPCRVFNFLFRAAFPHRGRHELVCRKRTNSEKLELREGGVESSFSSAFRTHALLSCEEVRGHVAAEQ